VRHPRQLVHRQVSLRDRCWNQPFFCRFLFAGRSCGLCQTRSFGGILLDKYAECPLFGRRHVLDFDYIQPVRDCHPLRRRANFVQIQCHAMTFDE
jgi:hypothetical protein